MVCIPRDKLFTTECTENTEMKNLRMEELNKITEVIIGAAIEVHQALGPGLLESAYVACLAYELMQRGFKVIQQMPLPLEYKGVKLDCGYRIDLLIEDAVIIEVKSVESLEPIHEAQLLSYLRLQIARLVCLLISM